jgi:hypothetical protein
MDESGAARCASPRALTRSLGHFHRLFHHDERNSSWRCRRQAMLNMGASGLRHPGQGRPACGVFDRPRPSLRSSDGERTVAGTGYDRGGQRTTAGKTTMETVTISLPAPGGAADEHPHAQQGRSSQERMLVTGVSHCFVRPARRFSRFVRCRCPRNRTQPVSHPYRWSSASRRASDYLSAGCGRGATGTQSSPPAPTWRARHRNCSCSRPCGS